METMVVARRQVDDALVEIVVSAGQQVTGVDNVIIAVVRILPFGTSQDAVHLGSTERKRFSVLHRSEEAPERIDDTLDLFQGIVLNPSTVQDCPVDRTGLLTSTRIIRIIIAIHCQPVQLLSNET